jgi:hypothetical protein
VVLVDQRDDVITDSYLQGQITAVLMNASDDRRGWDRPGWLRTIDIVRSAYVDGSRRAIVQALKDGEGLYFLSRPLGRTVLWASVGVEDAELDQIWREACAAVPDPALDQTTYEDYLRSDVWQRTRELALEYYGGKCCLCNSPEQLNVHHRTYERKGHERLADLIVLCRDCHSSYHGKKP